MERYFESKKNALSLRTALLTIQQNEHLQTNETINESSFGILRYYYYIHQGVDLVNLVSIDKNSIDAILSKITFHRGKRDHIDNLLAEINASMIVQVCACFARFNRTCLVIV